MTVKILNRIFQSYYTGFAHSVYPIDHGCHQSGLATAGRAGDHYQTSVHVTHVKDHIRDHQRRRLGNLHFHQTKGQGDTASLLIGVYPVSAGSGYGHGQIYLSRGLEFISLYR